MLISAYKVINHIFCVFQRHQELQDSSESGLPWQHCRLVVSEGHASCSHSDGDMFCYMVLISLSLIRERLLLEYERTGELLVDLGSDQTSLHNPFNGGYYPVQLSFRQANQLMSSDPSRFRTTVQDRFNKL